LHARRHRSSTFPDYGWSTLARDRRRIGDHEASYGIIRNAPASSTIERTEVAMRGLRAGLSLSNEQRTMVDELKRYLDVNFDPEHEAILGATPEWFSDEEFEWQLEFNKKLARDGWLVPHWPTEYGGRGWGPIERMLIREEMGYRRIPNLNANGMEMLAPILLRFGTPAQCEEHLPKLAMVERHWCQGYSEPDSGSDLTSLRTTAVRDGETYVVNGSKIWTGHAMRADWMFLLVRTDPESTGSRGISFLLVDLEHTDGITIHPIRSLTGAVTFCQEFFTDARVPVENLVGPEHEGWKVAGALLEHERAQLGSAARCRRMLDDLLTLVEGLSSENIPSRIAVKFGELIEKVESARALEYRFATEQFGGDIPSELPSILNLQKTELNVELREFATELLGIGICEHKPGYGTWNHWNEYLYSLLHRIAGGSNEIQRDIIASRRLGIGR
jgi:alkylation response protein AidB-like acyl-CoA dehydrogenase